MSSTGKMDSGADATTAAAYDRSLVQKTVRQSLSKVIPSSGFPNLLNISEAPFSLHNGFGTTLRTFFRDWPPEKFFQISTQFDFFDFSPFQGRFAFFLIPYHFSKRSFPKWLLGAIPEWRGHYQPLWLARRFRRWKPDAVYSLVCSLHTLEFADWIARSLRIPHIGHVADAFSDGADPVLEEHIRQLFSRMARRMVIGTRMKEQFTQRYGYEFQVFHNGPEEEALNSPALERTGNKVFTIRFLGSILPTYHHSAIEDILESVRSLNRQGIATRFEFCGGEWASENIRPLIDGDAIRYHPNFSVEEGIDLRRTADLLVHPVSFNPASQRFIQYSFPTKIPEYLGSGTPVLVYGPPECDVIGYFQRNNLETIIYERRQDLIEAHIKSIIANPEYHRKKAQSQREFARLHLGASALRIRLYQEIRSAVLEQGEG